MENKSVILTDGSRRIELRLNNIIRHDFSNECIGICIDNAVNSDLKVSICLYLQKKAERIASCLIHDSGAVYGNGKDHKTKQLIDLMRLLLSLNEPVETGLEGHYIDIILRLLPEGSLADSGGTKGPKNLKFMSVAEYIDRHIKKNISVQELMAVSNMSERALYYLFREVKNTTPLAFIRQCKIEQLQRELYDNHSTRNITQIAMDYGFTNLGRFADLYRKQVGELPSETRLKYA